MEPFQKTIALGLDISAGCFGSNHFVVLEVGSSQAVTINKYKHLFASSVWLIILEKCSLKMSYGVEMGGSLQKTTGAPKIG